MNSDRQNGSRMEGSPFDCDGSKPHCRLIASGVDVVSIGRIADLLDQYGQSFLDRVYAPAEITYCTSRASPAQHFAARWAAKEAAIKTLSAADRTIGLSAITVVRDGERPTLELAEPARQAKRQLANREGINETDLQFTVSLSHDYESSVAVAHVLVGYAPQR